MAACVCRLSPQVGRAPAAGGGQAARQRNITREELLAFFEGKMAKWWIPDDVAFVTEIPPTATGKMQKLKLHADQFKDYKLPTA